MAVRVGENPNVAIIPLTKRVRSVSEGIALSSDRGGGINRAVVLSLPSVWRLEAKDALQIVYIEQPEHLWG